MGKRPNAAYEGVCVFVCAYVLYSIVSLSKMLSKVWGASLLVSTTETYTAHSLH